MQKFVLKSSDLACDGSTIDVEVTENTAIIYWHPTIESKVEMLELEVVDGKLIVAGYWGLHHHDT